MRHIALTVVLYFLVLLTASAASAESGQRDIPKPLPNHPGNVFVQGEDISVPFAAETWRVVDYEGNKISEGAVSNGLAGLGRLPVGYYEIRKSGVPGDAPVTLCVLAPLAAPTPENSPISIDVAMSWFFKIPERQSVSRLCELAGINWVRDRTSWNIMEPVKGRFAEANTYDDAAQRQAASKLKVLQVHHDSPPWANTNYKRFPVDLRDAYNFQRAMAARWKSQVGAFEPWNEADIDMFGGQTGAEMAALQKASYLGLKAGNPDVVVCMNVFATAQPEILSNFHQNEAWPYFDKLNLHHYSDTDSYPGIYAAFRPISAGKPLWTTECNVPVHWTGDATAQEPSAADLRIQAERVAKIYAAALHEGPEEIFYFMLPHYAEGQTQFGVLHKDLTPRPAFAAIAASGRLLAGAKPLGRIPAIADLLPEHGDGVRAIVFRAFPDGIERDVLVAWTEGPEAAFLAPKPPLQIFDAIGRSRPVTGLKLSIARAPIFSVFEKGSFDNIALLVPARRPKALEDKPSTVVLQAIWPQAKIELGRSAFFVSSENADSIPVMAYNFGTGKAIGTFSVTAPEGWVAQFPETVEIEPGERKELALKIDCHAGSTTLTGDVKVAGDFSKSGRAILSLRLMPQPMKLRVTGSTPLPDATDPSRWQQQISNGQLKLSKADGAGAGVQIAASFGSGDHWVYPRLELRANERPAADVDALQFTLVQLEGQARYRVILEKENGSSYVVDALEQNKAGENSGEALALMTYAVFGTGWSKPDPAGKLEADQIRAIKIGCNATTPSVKFTIGNLQWVKIGGDKK